MTNDVTGQIDHMLHEQLAVAPSADFVRRARFSREDYDTMYRRSLDDPDGFWAEQAQSLSWFVPWSRVLDWQEPHARWFVGAQTNLCYNALDAQVLAGRGDKLAIVWEGEDGTQRRYSYAELLHEVKKVANVLLSLGVKAGDTVTVYLPLIPEAVMSMLACARIGAVHSVVFGGFSVSALADRIRDAASRVVITADGGYRKGAVVPLLANAEAAAKQAGGVEQMLVVRRLIEPVAQATQSPDQSTQSPDQSTQSPDQSTQSPDQSDGQAWQVHDWQHALQAASDEHQAAALDSEHPLFILYTSGSTGKPKGIVHTTGGYMVGVKLTTAAVFDLQEDDLYWCSADVGWITGHSYSVYGPLLNGASALLYEGAPNWPNWGRFWDIIQRHKVNILYTAPTAIRSFMRQGDHIPAQYDLSSLRLLGSVGEPINPEAWLWFWRVIGGERCPVVDTWWQTETGAIMLTTLPGAYTSKPGSAGLPLFGIDPAIVTRDGRETVGEDGGLLVIKRPWPSMLRGIYGDDERYAKTYWQEIPHVYFTGDGARRDADGYYTIMGRVDDVLNVSGHRLGTMEIESMLVGHGSITEAAVVGRPDDIKGEAVVAFVVLQVGHTLDGQEVRDYVSREIGALARPDAIYVADILPKTRSGKIMRRFLRQIAAGKPIEGDTSTLEMPEVLTKLQATTPL